MKGLFLRSRQILILLLCILIFPVPLPGGSRSSETKFTSWAYLSLGPVQGKGKISDDNGSVRLDNSITWDGYWKQVEDTYQEILGLEQAPADQARPSLDRLALQWEAVTTVELPDGKLVKVDHSYLASLLRSSPPDLPRLEHMFAALLAERETFIPGQPASQDLSSLQRILEQPEFQWKDQTLGQPNALDRLLQRIQRELSQLSAKILSFRGSGYLFGLGAFVLLAVALIFLFRNLIFGFVTEARMAPATRTGDEFLTADTALKRAQNLSRGGDYRSAVRYLYLSALFLLEERGLLRQDRTKTNREYLNSVLSQPQVETPLRAVVDVFERVWYGYQPLNDQEYQYYERQVGKLRQQRQADQQKSEGE